jgi:hypothetical protein
MIVQIKNAQITMKMVVFVHPVAHLWYEVRYLLGHVLKKANSKRGTKLNTGFTEVYSCIREINTYSWMALHIHQGFIFRKLCLDTTPKSSGYFKKTLIISLLSYSWNYRVVLLVCMNARSHVFVDCKTWQSSRGNEFSPCILIPSTCIRI